MIKMQRTPTVKALLIFSWLTAFFGLSAGALIMFFNLNKINLVIGGFIVIMAGLLLAVLIRAIGNISQSLFDLQDIISDLKKINCDSKDINQNIQQIKNFFEQIQRNLDLNK